MVIFNNGNIENMYYLIISEKLVRNFEFFKVFVYLLNLYF